MWKLLLYFFLKRKPNWVVAENVNLIVVKLKKNTLKKQGEIVGGHLMNLLN